MLLVGSNRVRDVEGFVWNGTGEVDWNGTIDGQDVEVE